MKYVKVLLSKDATSLDLNLRLAFQQTPVLQGGQGIGKTELGRALFGHDFYGDGLTPALDIDDVTKLQHVWGMELDELNGITRRTQVEKLKAFLSRRVDLVKRKYAPRTEPIQRRSTFWATTKKCPLVGSRGSEQQRISEPPCLHFSEWTSPTPASISSTPFPHRRLLTIVVSSQRWSSPGLTLAGISAHRVIDSSPGATPRKNGREQMRETNLRSRFSVS